MCGRYARRGDKQKIAEAFALGDLEELYLATAPSYNVAPTTMQPVVMKDHETGARELRIMRWGLVPFWTKDMKAVGVSTINARAEVVQTKPIWRHAFKKQRCLVPADALYEWRKLNAKTKQPYAFGMQDDAMFAFAGLWERWKELDGSLELESFSIIITEPNELVARVHNRMPVIIKQQDYDRWSLKMSQASRPWTCCAPMTRIR